MQRGKPSKPPETQGERSTWDRKLVRNHVLVLLVGSVLEQRQSHREKKKTNVQDVKTLNSQRRPRSIFGK